MQALWEEFLGEELLDVPRLSRIYYNGKFFNYPLRLSNAFAGLGARKACRILLSYLGAQVRPTPTEESFEQWVSNRFGSELYRIFFKTYTEKVWGIPCTEIRAEWAAQRIQGLSLARALISAVPLQRRSAEVRTLINEFKYPRLGPGQLWERCRDRVLALGGRLHLRHEVTSLEVEGGTAVVRANTPDGEARFDAEHVISTIPLRSLVRALGDAPPSAVRAAAKGLAYRDFLLVVLVLDRNNLFPDNWIYVHTPGVQVGRIQNFNNWSAALVPDPTKTLLGMEYFCFRTDELWRQPDSELLRLATRELSQLGLAPTARVLDGTVVRVTEAYPIYNATYREHLATIRPYLAGIPNLHTVGRNGMHKYNNQDHSMYAAMLTVENMHGASHDVWAVNTDYEYHEELRLNGRAVKGAGAVAAAGQNGNRG